MESILDDVLALIHKRENELRTELDRLGSVRQLLNGTEPAAAAEPVVAVTRKARRSLTPAQRKAISKAQKARWKAIRAAKS